MIAAGLLLAIVIIAGAVFLDAAAQEPSPASDADDAAIVTLLKEDGASVEFIGATPGLAGYRVTRADDSIGYTVYVTPSGHAVVGNLYAPDGLLLTVEQLATAEAGHAPASGAPPAEPTGSSLASPPPDPGSPRLPPTTGFMLGSAGRLVHVFADPACPFSRSTVARLARAALEGQLRLKVVPVALLGADSAHQALAAVGEDGATAWFDHRAVQPTPATAAAVKENNAALAATGHAIVPLLRTFAAGTWHVHIGAVDDVAAFLEALP